MRPLILPCPRDRSRAWAPWGEDHEYVHVALQPEVIVQHRSAEGRLSQAPLAAERADSLSVNNHARDCHHHREHYTAWHISSQEDDRREDVRPCLFNTTGLPLPSVHRTLSYLLDRGTLPIKDCAEIPRGSLPGYAHRARTGPCPREVSPSSSPPGPHQSPAADLTRWAGACLLPLHSPCVFAPWERRRLACSRPRHAGKLWGGVS